MGIACPNAIGAGANSRHTASQPISRAMIASISALENPARSPKFAGY